MATKVFPTPHVVVTNDGTNYKFNVYVGTAIHYSGPDTYTTYSEAASRGRQWINKAYEGGFLPCYGDN